MTIKLVVLFVFVNNLQVFSSAYSESTRLNVQLKNASMVDVLQAIEDQSEFKFLYHHELVSEEKKLNLQIEGKTVEEILDLIFEDSDNTYSVLDNNLVVIKPRTEKVMQDGVVSGMVTDAGSGEPLPGVSILIKGTDTGTVTDIEGNFTIEAAPSDVLVMSFVGYLTEEIAVGNSKEIDVVLVEDVIGLDEVVVIGYGTMKKKDLTGAVSSVKTADLQANNSTNVLKALQGTVSGLDVTTKDGQAGSEINITLRGKRSINANNDPLIMVDGVEYGNTLDINTSDIESIDILKDVASTAIYGSKGANGVILITTKRGSANRTKVSYSNYFSYNMPTFVPHVMNGTEYRNKQLEIKLGNAEYIQWYNEGGVEYDQTTGVVTWDEEAQPEPWTVFGSITLEDLIAEEGKADEFELLTEDPTALELLRNNVSLDYLDMIVSNSWSQNHEFSISSGNEKSGINLSFGILDDNGLLRDDKMSRYNLNIGVDHALSKTLKVGTNFFYTNKKFQKRNGSIFNQALKAGPIGTLYNEDGSYKDIPDPVFAYNQVSPMLDEAQGAQIHEIFSNRIFGSAYADWDILEGLKFRSNLGINVNLTREGEFNSGNSIQQHTTRESRADIINNEEKSYTWNNILTYTKSAGNHNIQVMAGSETYKWGWLESEMTGYNQPLESTEYYDFNGIIQDDRIYYSKFAEKQMVSFFGRTNYSLLEKYLFQATIRNDGSSVLYPGNKWEWYPSLSAGWRLSEEDFLKNISIINNLKLRYSWGIAGNAAVPPYSSQTKLSNELSYYTFGNESFAQYLPFRIGNANLGWEQTASHNVGIDFSIAKNRLSGSIEYYNSQSEDLLFQVPLPLVNAYPEIWDNVAATKNQGIEASLSGVIVNNRSVTWSADLNFAYNKGEVVELRDGVSELVRTDVDDKIWQVGGPVEAYYIYENLGIYQIEDLAGEMQYISQQNAAGDSIERGRIPMIANSFEPGDIKLNDLNGDGEFTEDDKIVLNASPDFVFGFGSNISIKTSAGDFGLRIYGIGRVGQTIDYGFYGGIKDSKDKTNGAFVEAWTPQNTDATFPRNSEYGNNLSRIHMNTLKFVDGSFFKIKDITFSYTLPNTWTELVKIDNVQLYATARNMFTFCKLENYDPEQGGSFSFPLQKNWIVGLNVNF